MNFLVVLVLVFLMPWQASANEENIAHKDVIEVSNRISAREETINRVREVDKFYQEAFTEFNNAQTEQDLTDPAVARDFNTKIRAKAAEYIQNHADSADSRARFEAQLIDIAGQFEQKMTQNSLGAQRAIKEKSNPTSIAVRMAFSKSCFKYVLESYGGHQNCSQAFHSYIEKLTDIFLKNLPELSPKESEWLSQETNSGSTDRMLNALGTQEGATYVFRQLAKKMEKDSALHSLGVGHPEKIQYYAKSMVFLMAIKTNISYASFQKLLDHNNELTCSP